MRPIPAFLLVLAGLGIAKHSLTRRDHPQFYIETRGIHFRDAVVFPRALACTAKDKAKCHTCPTIELLKGDGKSKSPAKPNAKDKAPDGKGQPAKQNSPGGTPGNAKGSKPSPPKPAPPAPPGPAAKPAGKPPINKPAAPRPPQPNAKPSKAGKVKRRGMSLRPRRFRRRGRLNLQNSFAKRSRGRRMSLYARGDKTLKPDSGISGSWKEGDKIVLRKLNGCATVVITTQDNFVAVSVPEEKDPNKATEHASQYTRLLGQLFNHGKMYSSFANLFIPEGMETSSGLVLEEIEGWLNKELLPVAKRRFNTKNGPKTAYVKNQGNNNWYDVEIA